MTADDFAAVDVQRYDHAAEEAESFAAARAASRLTLRQEKAHAPEPGRRIDFTARVLRMVAEDFTYRAELDGPGGLYYGLNVRVLRDGRQIGTGRCGLVFSGRSRRYVMSVIRGPVLVDQPGDFYGLKVGDVFEFFGPFAE